MREFHNSQGEWEPLHQMHSRPVGEILTPVNGIDPASPVSLISILHIPQALEKVGTGTLCAVTEQEGKPIYGRASTVADILAGDRVLSREMGEAHTKTGAIGRCLEKNGRRRSCPALEKRLSELKTPVLRFVQESHRILAHVSLAELTMKVAVDRHGDRSLAAH